MARKATSWARRSRLQNDAIDALIFAPIGRDATVAAAILAEDRYSSVVAPNLEECLLSIERCHCMVATDEALLAEDRTQFARWIADQPAWSDYPIVLLTQRGQPLDARLAFLGEYAITLERPFSPQALLAAVRSAVRARKRQLQVKAFLDERDRADERQRLLIRELHHRVKNMLANVQAVLGATARSAQSIEEFHRSFSQRIQSLAKTHSFLTDDYWQTASMAEMLDAELAMYDANTSRIALSGPDVFLVADQAVPLGMAFHELATNSVKYGSLSVPDGKLSVTWSVQNRGGREELDIEWRELDGPLVSPPKRKGFGTMLMERVLCVQLEAAVEMDFRSTGLNVTLSLPLQRERLVPSYG